MRLLSGQRKQTDTVNSIKTQRQQHLTPMSIDFFRTVKTSSRFLKPQKDKLENLIIKSTSMSTEHKKR